MPSYKDKFEEKDALIIIVGNKMDSQGEKSKEMMGRILLKNLMLISLKLVQ